MGQQHVKDFPKRAKQYWKYLLGFPFVSIWLHFTFVFPTCPLQQTLTELPAQRGLPHKAATGYEGQS